MKDYYKILGVDHGATEEDIKKAYRKLAHQHHPDKQGGNEAKFKEINEAYQVLSNRERRSAYDRFGTAEPFGAGAGQAWGGFGENPFAGFDFGNMGAEGADMGDIFDAFFEGMGVKQKRRRYERGADLEIWDSITLEEAFHGARRKLEYQTLKRCEACEGHGYDVKEGAKTCPACNGRGEIQETRKTFFGNFSQVRPCAECFGTGQKPNKTCSHCGGTGRMKGAKTISYDIIPGIQEGQIIKITGAGESGAHDAESGDLYVHIKVSVHAEFERRGNDLYMRKDLDIIDALLGEKIRVQGIDGKKIEVEIPSGFNVRENLKIKGEGMPRFHSFGRGDLFVAFNINMPKKLSAKAKKLLEELRGEL